MIMCSFLHLTIPDGYILFDKFLLNMHAICIASMKVIVIFLAPYHPASISTEVYTADGQQPFDIQSFRITTSHMSSCRFTNECPWSHIPRRTNIHDKRYCFLERTCSSSPLSSFKTIYFTHFKYQLNLHHFKYYLFNSNLKILSIS